MSIFNGDKGRQSLLYRQTSQQRSPLGCLCLYWHQPARDWTLAGSWVNLYLLNYVDPTAVHGTQKLVR